MNFLRYIINLYIIFKCISTAFGQINKISPTCPAACNCLDETLMHCQHADLIRIPPTSTKTLTLDLRFNKIEIIPEGVLNHLHKLNI
ncbi:Peroxidasin, partial [Trichoplax sp. H2]